MEDRVCPVAGQLSSTIAENKCAFFSNIFTSTSFSSVVDFSWSRRNSEMEPLRHIFMPQWNDDKVPFKEPSISHKHRGQSAVTAAGAYLALFALLSLRSSVVFRSRRSRHDFCNRSNLASYGQNFLLQRTE